MTKSWTRNITILNIVRFRIDRIGRWIFPNLSEYFPIFSKISIYPNPSGNFPATLKISGNILLGDFIFLHILLGGLLLHILLLYFTFTSYFTGLHILLGDFIFHNNFAVPSCCTVLYCTVLYCTVLYCTVLYCTVLYCSVLYTTLYCTVL